MTAPSNWLVFFPIAFAILVAVQMSAAVRGVARDSFVSTILGQLIIAMFGFALFGLTMRTTAVTIVWLLAFSVFVVVLWWKHRNLDRAHVLLTLQAAATPDERMLVAEEFCRRGQGLVRRLGARFRNHLSRGASWEIAVERTKLPITVIDILSVRLQARYGESPFSVQNRWNSVGYARYEAETQALLGRSTVCLWICILVPVGYMFSMALVPSFLNVFADLGITPPASLVEIDKFVFEFGESILTILIVSLVTLVACILPLIPLALWMFPWLAELPLMVRFFTGFYRAIGMSAFAQICKHERDLATACRAASEVIPLPLVAKRFRSAASLMHHGMEVNQALVKAGLVSRRELKCLHADLDATRIAWSLQQLAEWKLDKLLRRNSMIVQVVVVLTTILGAILIGSFAAAVIDALATWVINIAEF